MISKKLILRKLPGLILIVCLVLSLAMPFSAFAWDENTQGNSESENSTDIQDRNSGSTRLKGYLGKFDNTVEEEERPDPPEMDDWINVTMPTTVLFGSIIHVDPAKFPEFRDFFFEQLRSPLYHVYNHSARAIEIDMAAFTPTNDIDPDPGVGLSDSVMSGTTLSMLFISEDQDYETADDPTWLDGMTVMIRTSEDDFLGNGDFSENPLVQLPGNNAGDPYDQRYIIYGYLPGNGIAGDEFEYPPPGSPYKPTYTLSFSFRAMDVDEAIIDF